MRCSSRAFVLRGRPEPGLRMWECSTETAESSDTPPIHCVQHVQQSVDMSIQLPACLQCDPVQMAEVVQQEYIGYSSAGHVCTTWCSLGWMMLTLFTSQSTTVTACRVKTEGAKTGLLSVIWSPMTVIHESLALQPFSMHMLYPGDNEHSPWGCCIFFRQCTSLPT